MSTYLVLGGTGKTGRRVVDRLVAAGHTARSAARTPGAARPGVEPVRFDWDDATTHAPVLRGVEGVYVVSPALRLDHAPLIGAFGSLAREHGVARAVLLSARGVDQGPDNPMRQAEQALADSGLPHAVVRPSWFAQNFTETFFVPGADGVIAAPTGDGGEPFIDAEDIAEVAVAALTGAADLRAYDVSGPQALSFGEAAQTLGRHAGRPVRHVDLPVDAWVQGAQANGVPPAYAQMLGFQFTLIRDGHDAAVSPGVQQALGRPATAFEDWAAREAEALAA